MATTTYKIKSGDTLSGIAKKFGVKMSKLADVNNIKNVNRIFAGDTLIIPSSSSTSNKTTTTNKKKTSSNKATITHLDIQKDTTRTVFATWKWDKDHVDNYKVKWYYHTGDGVWFVGNEGTEEYKQSTYNAPSNATQVKFKVKPISTKHKVNKKDTSWWVAEWSTEKIYKFSSNPPVAPGSAPKVEINGLKLTASYTNLRDLNAKEIEFYVVKIVDGKQEKIAQKKVSIVNTDASVTCSVLAGREYKVKARSVDGKDHSAWTDYSDPVATRPTAPGSITKITALSETSVQVEWEKVSSAEQYTVEYTTNKDYFDANSGEVKSVTEDFKNRTAIITGMESGKKYFFRVRAIKGSDKSSWTKIKSITIGKLPASPTTWSSTTTATNEEDVILYWVHNTIDGSAQTKAVLELTINGVKKEYEIEGSGRFKIDVDGKLSDIEKFKEEDDKFNTNSCTIVTSGYTEGAKIEWRVKTAGIAREKIDGYWKIYSGWSIMRTVDIYDLPKLELRITDKDKVDLFNIQSFPFYIRAVPGPRTQTPIGYHLSIVSNRTYDTVDRIGNEITIGKGDEIYSEYFDTYAEEMVAEISADSIDLENGVDYIAKCIVSMDSGLTAEDSKLFGVIWEEDEYVPNAEITIDHDTLSAYIRPYCEYYPPTYYQVTRNVENDTYVRTDTKLDIDADEEITMMDHVTTDGDLVFSIVIDESEVLFCIVDPENAVPVEGVTLAVYRREYDGRFVEIASGIDHTHGTFVPDPHPALDFARYRIVATTVDTGTVTYTDLPGEPVGESGVIIQWDEKWTRFETSNEDEMEEPPWAGSMLKLPYNIDVSDSNKSDVSLINYIGRSHPVSYYGTQLGTTSTWNVEIPKSDKETLYALRRLAIWMGDVYVREPSGSGYWANISVSFSQKHCEVTIPVTLSITRVEGGM